MRRVRQRTVPARLDERRPRPARDFAAELRGQLARAAVDASRSRGLLLRAAAFAVAGVVLLAVGLVIALS